MFVSFFMLQKPGKASAVWASTRVKGMLYEYFAMQKNPKRYLTSLFGAWLHYIFIPKRYIKGTDSKTKYEMFLFICGLYFESVPINT